MTQMTQVDTRENKGQGNTNIGPSTRNRNWCFTLNNYTTEEVKRICELKAEYVFQEETGENKTPHLQGILMFKNPITFRSVKKKIPRAHIESCRDKLGSIKYCSKPESRTGEIYTNYRYYERDRHKDTTQTKKNLKIFLDPHSDEQKRFRQKTLDEFFESDEWKLNMGLIKLYNDDGTIG